MADKKRVLIIEDEKDMVRLLKIRLESQGNYEIVCAYDGMEGLSLAQKINPDRIILDLMLPKLDGYRVCRMLKFSDKYKHIPIIIYSARSQDEDKKLACNCGADAYISKSLGQEVLIDKLHKIISK